MSARKVTKRQAEAVLRAVEKRFKSWIDAGGSRPSLVMDYDWFGYGGKPTIVWEEGPFEWAAYSPDDEVIDEEFGFPWPAVKLPAGVYTEATTSWALAIYPTS